MIRSNNPQRVRRPRCFLGIAVIGGWLLVATASAAAGPSRAPAATTLLSGTFTLPAADSFGAPGFHEMLNASGRVARRRSSARRYRLTVALRDLGRPNQRCSTDHPLSGCATVDWADDPSRPHVPAGGVFSNRITLRLGSRLETLYLRPSGALALTPEPYAPG